MKIVILDDYQDAVRKLPCADKIELFDTKIYTNTAKGVAQLNLRLKDADILVLNQARTVITREILKKHPNLKLIVQIGKITGHIDMDACTDLNIGVIDGHDCITTTAEFTWALIMAAMRRIPQYTSMLKYGAWQQSGLKQAFMPPNFALGVTLKDKVLGIWGFGRIGSLIATYGKTFGMHILVYGSEKSMQKAKSMGYSIAQSKSELFQQSDVLSLHLRLTENNRHIVQLQDLTQMKPSSLFVNTADAGLVHTQALVSALNRGTPGMAAIDVYDSEPIMQGHALLRMENTICTPHIGNTNKENLEQQYRKAFDHILNYAAKKQLPLLNSDIALRYFN